MNAVPRVMRHLAYAVALPLLVTPIAASGAPARAGRAAAPARPAATKTVSVTDGGIIPLPLNPIVPASQRSCATRTASGLGYTMLRPGTGAKPAAGDTVLINYIGYLSATGAVFDQGMQSPLPVAEVIAGMAQGLQLMQRGGIVRLCVPAALGYGAQASGPIPAGSDLVFQVELVDFKTAAELNAMRAAQPAEQTPSEPAPPPPAPPQR